MAKKQCSGPCGKRKDADKDFYISSRSSWCKECTKHQAKAASRADKRLREAHPEEYREYLDEEIKK